MPSPRPPWWMYLVAASFLAYFGLLFYVEFWGPEPNGMQVEYRGGHILVHSVDPFSPAGRAGLQPGDRLIRFDGRVFRSDWDWLAIRSNFEVGRPHRLEIEREGQRLELILTFGRTSRSDWSLRDWTATGTAWGVALLTLILALVIAFSRPQDLAARVGGWFLAAAAVTPLLEPDGFVAAWRHLPTPLDALLWFPSISSDIRGVLFFTFCAIFPRGLFRRRWVWVPLWAPVVLFLPVFVTYRYRMVYQPERGTGLTDWFMPGLALTSFSYVVGGLAALVVNYRRLEDLSERRRVRLLLASWGVAALARLPETVVSLVSLLWPTLWPGLAPAFFSSPAPIILTILRAASPLLFAYAILRNRSSAPTPLTPSSPN